MREATNIVARLRNNRAWRLEVEKSARWKISKRWAQFRTEARHLERPLWERCDAQGIVRPGELDRARFVYGI